MTALEDFRRLGQQFGTMFAGLALLGRAFNQGIADAQRAEMELARRRALGTLTAEDIERMSVARYRRRIAGEREIGRRYVRQIAAEARRDLGIGANR